MKPFQQRGGARGLTRNGFVVNFSWPFATLRVESDAVCLKLAGRARRLPRAAIREIRLRDGLLSRGVHFHTENPGHEFTFWSFDRPALLTALETRGFAVTEHAEEG